MVDTRTFLLEPYNMSVGCLTIKLNTYYLVLYARYIRCTVDDHEQAAHLVDPGATAAGGRAAAAIIQYETDICVWECKG